VGALRVAPQIIDMTGSLTYLVQSRGVAFTIIYKVHLRLHTAISQSNHPVRKQILQFDKTVDPVSKENMAKDLGVFGPYRSTAVRVGWPTNIFGLFPNNPNPPQ
jgi:hypothetical protein